MIQWASHFEEEDIEHLMQSDETVERLLGVDGAWVLWDRARGRDLATPRTQQSYRSNGVGDMRMHPFMFQMLMQAMNNPMTGQAKNDKDYAD